LIGSIPGVLIGSQLSIGIPERMLRTTLATVLILSGIKLLDVPHSSTIIVAGLGVGAASLVVATWRRRFAGAVPVRTSSADLP
jgi:hypothetical protein